MPFEKGKSGNPNGRPKGTTDPIKQQFLEALNIVEKDKDKTFLQHLCEQAFIDNKVAIALAKKILPDISEHNLKTDQPLLIQMVYKYK